MSKIRVGVDISAVVYGRGVSRYTSNLVRALKRYPGLELYLYGSSLRQRHQLEHLVTQIKPAGSSLQSYPPQLINWLWNSVKLNPIQPQLPGIEVFHSWDWLQPPDSHLPLVSTIHDLAMLKYPATAHPDILAHHTRSWRILKERSAQIIAVSRATKKDIVELLDIPPERISVVYEALPSELMQLSQSITDSDEHHWEQVYHLDQPYILAVGTREPRKNLERLIEAWLPMAKEVRLLVAGEAGWDDSSRWQAKAGDRLQFLGRVSDQALAVLYSQAEVFAYPSLYEGFGLPILEAFYHGTPVLTSNVSSLPEVAGNAAELVDPLDVEAIRAGLTKLLNETPAQQQRRAQQMIVRLHLFDWQRVAQETVAVYQAAKNQWGA